MRFKINKILCKIMLLIMVMNLLSPYSNFIAAAFTTTNENGSQTESSEVVSEVKSEELNDISGDLKEESIIIESEEQYEELVNNDTQETLIMKDESIIKETKASYNVRMFKHPSLVIDDFSGFYGDLMYFKVNGDIVFCIESRKDVNFIAYDQSESGSYYSTFSSGLRQQIELISAYGIDKFNKTGNKDYLWATQLLIWKAIEPSKYNLSGGTSLQPEINVIYDLLNNHFKIPSFMGSKATNAPIHKLKWNGSKYTITLNDSNNVANYKLGELGSIYGGDYSVSRTGNSVTISTTNHNAVRKTISPKFTPYKAGNNKYYDGGQDLFQGKADPLPMYMKVEIEPALGHIKINKSGKVLSNSKSDFVSLSGAEFKIIDSAGKVVRTGTTNANGVLNIKNIPIGKYIVKEANAPNGYLVSDEKNATVNANQTTTLNIVDERAVGSLKIIKTGKELSNLGDEIVMLSGALFEIVDKEGLVVRTGVTDEKGELQFDGLLIGDYVIKEVGAPNGYLVSIEKSATVKTNEVTIVDIEDERAEGSLKIIKTGKELINLSDNVVPLSGAEFEICDSDGVVLRTGVTDENGELQFDGLLIGDYVIKEVGAPNGYLVSIEKNATVNANEVTIVDIEDERAEGSLKIIKTGKELVNLSDKIIPLQGAEFEVIDSRGSVVRTGVTDEKGELQFDNLLIGDYVVKEVGVPTGYLIAVEKNAIVNVDETTIVEIEDERATGKLKIIKTGENLSSTSSEAEALPGAKFELIDSNEVVVRSGVTDEKGELQFDGLLIGDYILKEVGAPEGYLVSVDKTLKIESYKTTTINIVDDHIEGSVILQKIGQDLDDTFESLKNVEFEIYQDNDFDGKYEELVGTYLTNYKGQLTVDKLDYGNYKVEEKRAVENYYADFSQEFKIRKDGEVIELSNFSIPEFGGNVILNKKIFAEIELTKSGESLQNGDDTFSSLSGAEFKVIEDVEANGKLDKLDELYAFAFPSTTQTTITDSVGSAKFTNLDSGKSYLVFETKAPEGYVLDTSVYPISKDIEHTQIKNVITYKLDVNNRVIRGQVELLKVGSKECDKSVPRPGEIKDCQIVLENVKFNIYNDINKNGKLDKEDNKVQTITTNDNGIAKSLDLKFGSYLLSESKTLDNYYLNDRVFSFEIKNDREIVKINNGTAIENIEKVGKIQLLKVGSKACDRTSLKPGVIKDCQVPLANIEFHIYNDLNANGMLDEEEDTDANIVETITTNDNGIATSGNLSLKSYLVREAKSLDNYFINENIFKITLTEANKVVHLNSGIAIENIEKLGQVKVTKKGNEIGNLNDELVFLANAEYTIFNSNGDIVEVLVTDENGNAKSSLLSFGKYFAKETKAPVGYLLDETEHSFTIDNETYDTLIELEFEDKVITNEIEITKTDLATGDELEGAKLQVLDSNGTVVEEWISTSEIHTFTLEYGDYIIMEEFAPEGYLPLLEGVKFSVTEDGVKQKFKIDNKLITNEISVTKTDLATGDELAGAKLQVLDSKGKIVEEWISTTEVHEFTLPYGDYVIMEEFAPEGYLPLLEGVKFSITEDGVKQSFKIENKLKPAIEETGQNSYLLVVFISLIILIALKYAINIRKAIPKLGGINE